MADVQLEHGHVRIANRLLEAVLHNDFSGAQQTILFALVRLTYGWRRKTVTCSQQELAGFVRMGVTGNFRSALRELVAHGVVLELEKGSGRTKSTWAIQKDFTQWGKFATASKRLESIFGARPACNDDLLRQADLFNNGDDEEADRMRSASPSSTGQSDRPVEDGGTGSKSLSGETVAPRKDSERQEKDKQQQNTTPAKSSGGCERLLEAQAGDALPDLKRWLDERPADRREDWARELLRIMGPTTGVIPEDLANATRQARLATPPATNVKALEVFALSCRDARVRPRSHASPKPGERIRPQPTNSAAASPYAAALSGDDQ